MIETMVSHIPLTEGGPNASDVRQFVAGFVSLVQSAAGGDNRARDEYLTAVIPSVKHAGISLELTIVSLVQVSVLLTGLLGREHLPWLTGFLTDYTRSLMRIWQDA
jgi:hypothetical protein